MVALLRALARLAAPTAPLRPMPVPTQAHAGTPPARSAVSPAGVMGSPAGVTVSPSGVAVSPARADRRRERGARRSVLDRAIGALTMPGRTVAALARAA